MANHTHSTTGFLADSFAAPPMTGSAIEISSAITAPKPEPENFAGFGFGPKSDQAFAAALLGNVTAEGKRDGFTMLTLMLPNRLMRRYYDLIVSLEYGDCSKCLDGGDVAAIKIMASKVSSLAVMAMQPFGSDDE